MFFNFNTVQKHIVELDCNCNNGIAKLVTRESEIRHKEARLETSLVTNRETYNVHTAGWTIRKKLLNIENSTDQLLC